MTVSVSVFLKAGPVLAIKEVKLLTRGAETP